MRVIQRRSELHRRAAEELFAKDKPMSEASAHAVLGPAEFDKARLFALTRGSAVQAQSAIEHRRRLEQAAGLVPSFAMFRQWCLKDLKAAFLKDRRSTGARTARNHRMVWLHLFKYFARLHKIDRALAIRALDRQGNYACELIERPVPDLWERWFREGRKLGIAHAELMRMYREALKTGKGAK